ncbi:MAG: ActS/PrrB/RegB family redox-sensitive histidine kinase [Candidatus Pelagibacter sp.]
MKFIENSELYNLNRSTYVNLRWIAFVGQIFAIFFVEFILKFQFNYIPCLVIIFLGVITNLFLQFKIKGNQLNNFLSLIYLTYDILQLTFLFFLTGGITNPFIFLLIIPAVFSSQYLSISSSIILVSLTIVFLIFLTFFYFNLPHPSKLHFHVPDYYLYAIPTCILIGLIFLVYFAVQFGEQNRKRKKAFDKIQEIMAKENELLSLGGQAAAAAHSLGTPLSTILLTVKELQKDFKDNKKLNKDLELLVSQSQRCKEILKKLSLNPKINDDFLNANLNLSDYLNEIIRSFQEISEKIFNINLDKFSKKIIIGKSTEIIYGLRNFIGNANKFSKKKVDISIITIKNKTLIKIVDDGKGFPKDLINKEKIGQPYIRTLENTDESMQGLGLGTFIGKTLLEKNFATVTFKNSDVSKGAEVNIEWDNNDLKKI